MMIAGDGVTVANSEHPNVLKISDFFHLKDGTIPKVVSREEMLVGLAEVADKYGTEVGKKHLLIVDRPKTE